MISQKKENEIKRILKTVSEQENVSILFAVEHGSRAFGFNSVDSDYDVRFVYYMDKKNYLSIHRDNSLDTITDTVTEDIEIQGFDILKFGRLLGKSNPNMIEWVRSPICYYNKLPKNVILNYLKEFYNPVTLYHHYHSMAEGNFKKYFKSSYYLNNKIPAKRYLHCFRGILSAKWIQNHKSLPPIDFCELVSVSDLEDEIKKILIELVRVKRETTGKFFIKRDKKLDITIEKLLADKFDTATLKKDNTFRLDYLNRLDDHIIGIICNG